MAGEKLETVDVQQKQEDRPRINSFGDFWTFFKSEFAPKQKRSTAFNLLSGIAVIIGVVVLAIRFFTGLGQPVTNLDQSFPFGLWMGFYIMSGVALSGGAYVLAFIVYILGAKKFRPVLRAAVLNALVFYVFSALVMFIALGRWWNIPNVFIGNFFGASSVMFIVLWLFLLYIVTLALEFSPTVAEWAGTTKLRKTLGTVAFGAAICGITISVLQQGGMGALLSMAKAKLHPLWYSEFLPAIFFISSIYAGIAMVIFMWAISRAVFSYQMDEDHRQSLDGITLTLGRICGGVIFAYVASVTLVALFEGDFAYIDSAMGYWWLLEMVGFVAIPGLMFIHGAQKKNPVTVHAAAVIAIAGVLLNRYNSVFLAYNWDFPFAQKYVPSAMEYLMMLAILSLHIWVFRWVVNRMPVMRKSPQWAAALDKD